MKKVVSTFLAILLYAQGSAQTPTEDLEMQIESIAEGSEDNETDLVQLAENLQEIQNNPIAINFARTRDLERIPYLNIFQINNLLQYRDATGPVYSAYELAAVKGFDKETIAKVLPYISFSTKKESPNLKLKNVWQYSRHDIIARVGQNLQPRRGFLPETNNGYLGDPQNYYIRYRGKYRNLISFGLVAQHDPGEPFGGASQATGFDHLSGFVALQNYGNLKKLIVGDYQTDFGQGMALWTSLAFGKSAEAVEIKRYAQGFRPFTGSEENRFFRGAAITYGLGKFEVSAFFSSKTIDANVSSLDSNDQPLFVSSLQTTGLHRTANELADKNANKLQALGGNVKYQHNNLAIGLTGVNYQLETPLAESTQLYQNYRFSGNKLSQASLDFNYLWRDLNLFGEVVQSSNNAYAGTIGLQSNPADGFLVTLLYRHLQRDYQFIYNAPFAESGQYGEKGSYLGLQWQLNSTFLLKSYVDIYRFDWLRFGIDAPSNGRDLMAQLEMTFNSSLSSYIRVRNEINQINSTQETPIRTLANRERSTLRFHTTYTIGSQIRLASRAELSFFDREERAEKGSVVFQDIRYKFRKAPLQLTARYAIINTESYDARIYAYENDLTYVFSIPPYFGRSNRFYLMADYDVSSQIGFQIRYAITRFSDRDAISSGLQEIEGNVISELKAQIRMKF